MTSSLLRRSWPLLFVTTLFAQAPSVDLMVKAKSGFLNLGGSRIVRLELANELRLQPLTSDNVNEGEYYYVLCSPTSDWQIDADFFADELLPLSIQQDDGTYAIVWKGEIVSGTILLGFPKALKIHQPFSFFLVSGDSTYRAEMTVPEELWPGFSSYSQIRERLERAQRESAWTTIIDLCNKVLAQEAFRIFPSFEDLASARTAAFRAHLDEARNALESFLPGEPQTLRERIIRVDSLRPAFRFVLDSLPRPDLQITSLLPVIADLMEATHAAELRLAVARDSLQRALDDHTIRWILEGSFYGKNALRYQDMIEALVLAFASVSPADTIPGSLAPRLPAETQERLARQNLTESYETFIRICLERHSRRAPLFPPEFLPNLRKDSVAFPLPYYSMLRATGEYFGGSLALARSEIATIVRTSYNADLTRQYDLMRIFIGIRENPPHPDIVHLLAEGEQREGQLDTAGVHETYRLLSLLAPTFAYGYYIVGTVYERMNDDIRALNSFQTAYQLDTLFLSAYREAFSMLVNDSMYEPALSVYQSALSRGNDCWEVRFNLGKTYLVRKDAVRAVAEYEKALAHNPKSYDAWVQCSLAYQAQKNFSKARQCLGEAMKIDPANQLAVDLMKSLQQLQAGTK
ncbi:MAG: tetratricopeptide repeat protein [Bacteroidetes bacterium]|jgi:tetratricopeptide (TPR) repeat protein|nr:tetratricopeptide repeat protein [Bacteroidota bacterium]